MKRERLARLLRVTGLGAALGKASRWSGIVGLSYHRIGDFSRSLFDRGLWSATAETFDLQMRLLKSHCDVVSPDDLPEILRHKRGRYVLITFDDGYLEHY